MISSAVVVGDPVKPTHVVLDMSGKVVKNNPSAWSFHERHLEGIFALNPEPSSELYRVGDTALELSSWDLMIVLSIMQQFPEKLHYMIYPDNDSSHFNMEI
jgi:hypothetical protein